MRDYEKKYSDRCTDDLTGAYSRDYLRRFLDEENRRPLTAVRNISIVMLQMKPIDEADAHLSRADVELLLRQTARVIRSKLPEEGLLARCTQDTFAAVLPGVWRTGAIELARDLGVAMREDLRRFPPFARVKIRIGTAHGVPGDKNENALLDRAMRALRDASR